MGRGRERTSREKKREIDRDQERTRERRELRELNQAV